MKECIGKVYLVGAGPGNIAYLTLRAKQLLSQAQVLVYDALVDPQILTLVPANCLKVNVGKRGGCLSTSQETINHLLVQYCQQGKQVVRLKSGDPFIFGRASVEMQALTEAGCDFELVPGISAAIAAPLLAGIPLTDKECSRCFAVLSAHEPETLDWKTLAQIDTLVILMGGSSLGKIVRQLQECGRSHREPIAIVRHCSRPEQQIWTGTLGDILEKTAGVSLSPAVMIIGQVVDLRTMPPSSASIPPLTGKTILVTRAAEQSSQFTHLLQQQGATVIEMPALEITPPSSWEKLDRAIAHLSEFHWLILTSANAVNYFWQRLATLGKDARALAGVKIAVVGQKTAATLQAKGLQPDFIPPDFVADSLVDNFPEPLAGQKVLFPRVETGGREVLAQELTARGAEVVEVPAYQSGCPAQMAPVAWEALQRQGVDLITFASSKTVRNFYHLLESALIFYPQLTPQSLLESVCLASIGPQTSATCRQLCGRVDVEAQEYTLAGLTAAIVQKYQGALSK